jgi:hypothetical protein
MAFFEAVLDIQKKNLQHKINEVTKLLEVENKNIVFIGTIGVGKTTAICSLFNLFDTSINPKKPILATGAGATTICEVEIEFGGVNQIRIDPYSSDELEQFINEYIDTIIGRNTVVDGVAQKLTTELERAVKFMIAPNMPLNNIDAHIQNIIKNTPNNPDRIRQLLIDTVAIQNRNQVVFTNTNHVHEEQWLRTTFSDINNGKIATASIPKKIYITINSVNKVQNKIIDTKGMDSRNPEFLREDLDRYIKNPDNLIVYCSSFPAAPDSDIMESIKYYNQKFPEIYKRMILLIIPKHDEPVHVQGVDDTLNIDTYQQGLQLREDAVINQIVGQIRNRMKILFHNLKIDLDRIHLNHSTNDILDFQNELINNLKSEEIDLNNKLNKLTLGELTPEQKALEQSIIMNINNLKVELNQININPIGFIQGFKEQYGLRYQAANTKNAIHVRLGKFNTKNIYFDFEVDVEKVFIDLFSHSNILAKLQRNLGLTQVITQEIVPSIHEDIENRIVEMNSHLTSLIRAYFENAATNYIFWQPLIARWGGGSGYNIDVKYRLQQQMGTLNIENEISNQFQNKWNELVDDFIDELN